MKDNKNNAPETNETEKYEGKAYAFIAVGLTALAALFFGLSFTVMGIYSLIASIILYIAALTFINIQKKRNNLKWLFYFQIVTYVLFGIAFLFFAGGILWSGEN